MTPEQADLLVNGVSLGMQVRFKLPNRTSYCVGRLVDVIRDDGMCRVAVIHKRMDLSGYIINYYVHISKLGVE